jgi:type IV secretory pathway VirB2 component (pilin)
MTTGMTKEKMMNEPTQFVAGWGTLSLVNAGLAQSKGRSGLLWWLLSLLLGPAATFLIVVLDKVAPKQD